MIISELDKKGQVSNRVVLNRQDVIDRHYKNNKKFAKIWTSYIFVFTALLITFAVVFVVGYMINSMTYQGTNIVSKKLFNPSRYQYFNEKSNIIIQRAKVILQKSLLNLTNCEDAKRMRYLHSRLFRRNK